MLKRDYILRMMESLSAVLPYVLQLRQKKHFAEALAILDRSGQELLNLNTLMLNSLATPFLLELLNADTPEGAQRCLLAADLLSMEGDVYADMGLDAESASRWLKALQFYVDVLLFHSVGVPSGYLAKVETLDLLFRAQEESFDLPWQTAYNLFQLYKKAARYAKAEDTLFNLIERPDAEPLELAALIGEGVTFYEALLRKSAADLIAGELPRSEVETGLSELLDLQADLGHNPDSMITD